ncbi:hypothetical protein CTAYLR_009175 [Chrysophaeum taylorii]|uniref:DOT1 domain-containing protein n=1 Tax=Chrysophaeum taylorii TaxID=2483200 RepID=A0AAD7XKL1_9STRA|nr:hypothetical protein CTAYLR_009175 [Chrysophaeum taylorii]
MDLEVLALRIAHTPADPGVRETRWKDILQGRKRADAEADVAAEVWEKLCGQLPYDVEAAWHAVPEMHALRSATAVNAHERDKVRDLIEELCVDATLADGVVASRKARVAHKLHEESWSYSEIDAVFLFAVLLKLKRIHGHLRKRGTFVDCGSGFGKNAFVAAIAHPWQRIVGIEALDALCLGAEALLERFHDHTLPRLRSKDQGDRDDTDIEFVRGDFLTMDLVLTGTLIYADLTCLNSGQLVAFRALVDEVTHGTVVVTLTRPLLSEKFFLLWQEQAPTSWGHTQAFVWERKPPPPEEDP